MALPSPLGRCDLTSHIPHGTAKQWDQFGLNLSEMPPSFDYAKLVCKVLFSCWLYIVYMYNNIIFVPEWVFNLFIYTKLAAIISTNITLFQVDTPTLMTFCMVRNCYATVALPYLNKCIRKAARALLDVRSVRTGQWEYWWGHSNKPGGGLPWCFSFTVFTFKMPFFTLSCHFLLSSHLHSCDFTHSSFLHT